jgi:hypothetical protein
VLDPQGDVVGEGVEHGGGEPRGLPLDGHDRQRRRGVERRLHPAGHHEVGEVDDVVAVGVGEEDGVELVRLAAGVGEAEDGAAPGVELERGGAVPHEHPGAGPPRARGGGPRCP